MGQTVIIRGKVYPAIGRVYLPLASAPETTAAFVDTTGTTALAVDLLAGKTAWAENQLMTGTMPDQGAVTLVIERAEETVSIPAGYHDGQGSVKISPAEAAKVIPENIKQGVTLLGVTGGAAIADTTLPEGEALTAEDLLAGKKGWANGVLIAGTMPDRGTANETITTPQQVVTLEAGRYAGGRIALEEASQQALVPENLRSGVTILGVTGSAAIADTTLPVTGAGAADVLEGKQAWVNGVLVTGTMPDRGAVTAEITAVGQVVTLQPGRYAESTVTIQPAEAAKLVAGNVRGGVTILGVAGSPMVADTTLAATAAQAGDLAQGKQAWVNGTLLTGTGTRPTISLAGGVLSIR